MENPFKKNLETCIEYGVKPGSQPGLPINKKVYTIKENLLPTEYLLAAGKEIYEQNLTGNILSLLRIQNNQTEILSYICRILFEEISENKLEKIKEAIQFNKEILLKQDEYENRITILETKLEEIANQLKQINKEIEDLNKKL
uniref:Uncharacterized protein n=1 Tax=Hibiscus soymovirus TaxID=3023608 RepID=A0AAF1C0V9_9VIRU|nr:hypothetical protein [Hibiscus soymovirus]